MSESLTTLQLAERIFDAVAHAIENGTAGANDEPPGAVVLDVLRRSGYWFCRMAETSGEQDQPLPFDQAC